MAGIKEAERANYLYFPTDDAGRIATEGDIYMETHPMGDWPSMIRAGSGAIGGP